MHLFWIVAPSVVHGDAGSVVVEVLAVELKKPFQKLPKIVTLRSFRSMKLAAGQRIELVRCKQAGAEIHAEGHLKIGDNHEQKSVRSDASCVRFVEAHLPQVILEHQRQRLDLFRHRAKHLMSSMCGERCQAASMSSWRRRKKPAP